ncbi:MAG TPA: RHS repeat-associated core domain-containing protein [Candidatus Nanoarchaeia archaeon]|nr:RHS repeat-associated core domain-containing protein [Candidatus Nanoarchaeia archaeon]
MPCSGRKSISAARTSLCSRQTDGSFKTYYLHSDWLGTVRKATSGVSLNEGQCTNYPFGDDYQGGCTGAAPFRHFFTDYVRDSESGLEHSWFRQYSSRVGRYGTPDLMLGIADDPQSWNRYAYVENDPVDWIDPFGLQPAWECFNYPIYNGESYGRGTICILFNGPDDPPDPTTERGGRIGGRPNRKLTPEQEKRFTDCMQRKTQQADAARKQYQDKSSDRVFTQVKRGAITGAGRGAAFGFASGEAFFGIGGVPGAGIGATIGGITGASAGALKAGFQEPLKDWFHDKFTYQPALDRAVIECSAEALTAPPPPPKTD